MAPPHSRLCSSRILSALVPSLMMACGGAPARVPSSHPGKPPVPDLAVVGPAFAPRGGGQPFRRFIADRAFMHGYLYNGDDLFPKQVNLCARGRSALLDLDLGPGASDELGFLGPAWDAHLTAVALDRDPERPLNGSGHTRFLYAWPAVSTAQLDRLRDAHELGRAAREGGPRWSSAALLGRRTGFEAMWRRLRAPVSPSPPAAREDERARAARWSRALMGALLERLWYSAEALPPATLGMATSGRAAYDALVVPFFELSDAAASRLDRFLEALEAGGRRAGLLFDSRRFRRFHDDVLLADLGPSWRHGRVSVDQLQAIIDQMAPVVAGSGAPIPHALLGAARREQARLRYILEGKELPSLPEAKRAYGTEALLRDRRSYVTHKRAVNEARVRLSGLARRTFTPAIRRALHQALRSGDDPLVAGSFYFDTEHLLETTSGFTHAGIIKRLEDPKGGVARLWMFDRVLGFHYAYPVAKLAHSVPVEVLALPRAPRGGRVYHWVRLVVPVRFTLGGGHVSGRVTLHNLFSHLKERLRACPALVTRPGFFYSAISWITAHPVNRLTLADLWAPAVHTGFGYRTLHPERLQGLKGRTLYLPVRLVMGAPWTAACPPRLGGAPASP